MRLSLLITAVLWPTLIQAESTRVIDGRAVAWKAISGHQMLIRGEFATLKAVLCPPISTPEGRDAKTLLNAFMKSGRGNVRCIIDGPEDNRTVECFKERRSFATGMIESGLYVAH
ncbi:hypothetical protein [Roseovarius sp. EL26]|uniref:hypothetical protein n=1 Tax=Roseovarius sp. EL26 TaxID=2126672 RepID=UPI000EA12D0C|nr:hypothetical protein [Roseovarius sp. EL26]